MGLYTILLVAHTILVLFLIIMVLLQRTDSDGLSGLGGGGGNQFMTGRGTANFMTRTTTILAAAFMATSLILAVMANHMNSKSIIDAVPVESSATGEKALEKTPEEAAKIEKKSEAPATPVVPKPE